MGSSVSLLAATNLTCARGTKNLFEALSLNVAAGDFLLITGANGSGKSTLLRTLAGLRAPLEGTLHYAATPLYIGHTDALNGALNVMDHLAFWAGIAGQKKDEAELLALLAKVGLNDLATTQTAKLSAGQKRRLNLCRLKLRASSVWLLDEPHASLDAAGITLLKKWIADQRVQGGAVIATSHSGLEVEDGLTLSLIPAQREAA
jgi:heme exporter protein A